MGGRGRRHGRREREVTLVHIAEAQAAGARLHRACEVLGISARTIERWRGDPTAQDGRYGPQGRMSNALSPLEETRLVALLTSPEYRELPPKQLVPALADKGIYLASESTIYRLQRRLGLRAQARPTSGRRVTRAALMHSATGPNQVWSWDITYLPTLVRGRFFYLYLVLDVWSRRIVGFRVHEFENPELAAEMIRRICIESEVDSKGLVLHSDNGNPMRGSTMLATLRWLGIVPSFSRPHVSDDNPYSESLFRTLKHGPAYLRHPFANLDAAETWVTRFAAWYNGEHRHSAIRFVTPDERHFGHEKHVLAKRESVYADARRKRPRRWARQARNWKPIDRVVLNPPRSPATDAA